MAQNYSVKLARHASPRCASHHKRADSIKDCRRQYNNFKVQNTRCRRATRSCSHPLGNRRKRPRWRIVLMIFLRRRNLRGLLLSTSADSRRTDCRRLNKLRHSSKSFRDQPKHGLDDCEHEEQTWSAIHQDDQTYLANCKTPPSVREVDRQSVAEASQRSEHGDYTSFVS